MSLAKKLAYAAPAILIVAFCFLFWLEYHIDDDRNLKANPKFVANGGSAAVAMAATLMDLEINHSGWAPNKLWFWPIAHSTNMKSYQTGIQYAVARWANEMSDFLGRERGSGEADPDLTAAKGKLSYDPTAFLLPSAVSQYNEALDHLLAYNKRLSQGQARYDRIASSLSDFLIKIDKDLGSQSAALELTVLTPDDFTDEEKRHLTDNQQVVLSGNGGYFDSRAGEAFFATKGRLYAYYVILQGIGEDFHDVIVAKGGLDHWENMLISLRSAATQYKFFVANGSVGSYFVPSDLATQGFFLLRADKQLQEVADILNR